MLEHIGIDLLVTMYVVAMMDSSSVALLLLFLCFFESGHSNLPVFMSPMVIPGPAQNGRSCPSNLLSLSLMQVGIL